MTSMRVTGRRLAALLETDAARGAPSPGPRYREIAEAVRLLAVDGRLPVGARMPSERELTDALGTSRTTVSRAYDHLRESGYLLSRRGSGSLLRLPPGAARAGRHGTGPVVGPGAATGAEIDLTFAALPADPRVAGAFEAALERLPEYLAGPGVSPLGLPELRGAVAQRYARRGLPTSPDQVVVTTGAVAGLAALAHALLAPTDRALVEHPVYPGSLAVLRRVGARLLPWAVDGPGSDVEGLATLLRQGAPRVAFITPDFHNPTGRYLDGDARRDIARVLARAGTVAVVDETLADTGLDPDRCPAAPLAAFAPGTFSVGSTSKSFWNGLRVGWVRAPAEDVGRVVAARAGLDLGAPVLEQLVAAHLLQAEPWTAPSNDLAKRRRDHLVAAVRNRLPDWEFAVPPGGHSLWCRLPVEASTVLAERCAAAGVLLAPGSAFSVDERGLDRFVRLPYTLDEAALSRAVDVVATVWPDVRDRPARRGLARTVVT